MKYFLFPIILILVSIPKLKGQEESRRISIGLSFQPQVSSMLNGNKIGSGRSGFGFSLQPVLSKKLTNRLNFEAGIQFQKANLKQRYHELQWPSDVINGMWDPTRSHEQYEANYLALGLMAGVNLKLGQKVNAFSLGMAALVQRVFNFENKLIINESGHYTDFDQDGLDNQVNETQLLVETKIMYEFSLNEKAGFSIGPSVQYSLTDLLRKSTPNLLWSYGGGHPFFLGVKFSYKRHS